jgi:hypothetical protein
VAQEKPYFIPPVAKDNLAQQSIGKTQQAVSDYVLRLNRQHHDLAGVYLKNVEFDVGKNKIAHGLGRPPEGVDSAASAASGAAPAMVHASKNGDMNVETTDAWNDVVAWTEMVSQDGTFDQATGIWTCPRTGVYHIDFQADVYTVVNATYGGARLLSSTLGAHGYTFVVGADSAFRVVIPWMTYLAAGSTIKPQIYRNTASLVFRATSDNFVSRFIVTPDLGFDIYAWDENFLYIQSNYTHTRTLRVW